MNISLAPWKMEDVSTLAIYYNNSNIWINLRDEIPNPYSEEDAIKFISTQLLLPVQQNFAIYKDSEIVGGIGITLLENIYKMNVELGYWIAEPFWGQGIATKAVGLMTQYVFDNFAINRIIGEVFEYNKSSMRVLEKNGFYLECVRRKGILKNDYLIDDFIWVKQKIY